MCNFNDVSSILFTVYTFTTYFYIPLTNFSVYIDSKKYIFQYFTITVKFSYIILGIKIDDVENRDGE